MASRPIPLTSSATTSKNFAYQKGTCSLSFNLRTDVKIELKDFLEMLKLAAKDVEAELNKK